MVALLQYGKEKNTDKIIIQKFLTRGHIWELYKKALQQDR